MDKQTRRLIIGDTIAGIHHRPGGAYDIRRVRPPLLNDYDMIVNRKLARALMRERSRGRVTDP